MAIVGAVLCGGASRRMGRDKALVEVDGVALARRVGDALTAGGCARVVAVGGDADALGRLGLVTVADRWPGEGPLGGLVTALDALDGGDVLVVAPCDWVHPSGPVVARLVATLDAAPSDVGAVHGRTPARDHWLPSAWRAGPGPSSAVGAAFAAGERRVRAALALVGAGVVEATEREVADADTPGDLPPGTPGPADDQEVPGTK